MGTITAKPILSDTAAAARRLRIPQTCTLLAKASRAAVLIDCAQYFAAAKEAMQHARASILLLGWDFDPRTLLEPAIPTQDDAVLALFLNRLQAERPQLDIRILIWKMSLAIAAQHRFFPHRSGFWLDDRIQFRLDGTAPYGASRHEKLLVVDDAVAFCGGSDFGRDRLDVRSHPAKTPWRRRPNGDRYPPRHDVMLCVDGEAARALGEHARERWHHKTGEIVPVPAPLDDTPWPSTLAPHFKDISVGFVRTRPAEDDAPPIRQSEALYLAAIASAKRLIYLENQYFTAPNIREALTARLREPDGPQIVLICTYRSPSYFDRATMDSTRDVFVTRLRAADAHNRLRVYAPRTKKGRPIIVHSKLAIFDDRLLRIGSSNLNKRSAGYDTEADLAIEAEETDAATKAQIVHIRNTLIGHFIGWSGETFAAHRSRHDSLIAALDALGEEGARLKPYQPKPLGFVSRFVAAWHLGDPGDESEAWNLCRRQKDEAASPSAMSTIKGK